MKKRIVLLCLVSFLCFTNGAWAAPFPEKSNEIVQDEEKYLKKEEIAKFAESIKNYTGKYKVVVVEGIVPEAQTTDEYAQKSFDFYNLSEDSLMIVLDMDTQQLGVFAGPTLQAKGAKPELLHENITSFYDPFRNQKEYLKGIELFISETNSELQSMAQAKSTNKTPAVPAAKAVSKEDDSLWSMIPWWLYGIVSLFFIALVGTLSLFSKRRKVLGEVDEVENWKDELVEKIQVIEVEKSLRRVTGLTEEQYTIIANRKENMMRVQIPDVEMIILEADEACDRFKFQAALTLLIEAKEILTNVEKELQELKEDSTKVVQTKKESKIAVPEIDKLVQQVERKLSNARLEYGLAFHEIKFSMDEIEKKKKEIKEALAVGDEVKAYETAMDAQNRLKEMGVSLERLPTYIKLVRKEMPEELKQLEEGISSAVGDGYDLHEDYLDSTVMQAKQLLQIARSALEEGNLSSLDNHVKAFELLIETAYQNVEQTLVSKKQVEASIKLDVPVENLEEIAIIEENKTVVDEADWEPALEVEGLRKHERKHESEQEAEVEQELEPEPVLFAQEEVAAAVEPVMTTVEMQPEELEYELVIPKHMADEPKQNDAAPVEEIVITNEDEALDELERISGALVRIRQRIKRSYLPGIPLELKVHFENVVQLLGLVQITMERNDYHIEEVAELLYEANAMVVETNQFAEHVITTCQYAEGAIQYTNRYRRQNRQVNELLTRAEQAFRLLDFNEAVRFAEEARLVIEGDPEEATSGSRWYLRRKKKGAGS